MGLMDGVVLKQLKSLGWSVREATPAEVEALGNFFGQAVAGATVAEKGIDASISVRKFPTDAQLKQ